jgi:hypothetical protein
MVPGSEVSEQWSATYEPAMFAGQTVALPVMLVVMRPYTPVVWQGQTVPRTYTAQPPLPD